MQSALKNSIFQTIHFNRWSNTSYAVFNSIGKIIHIGELIKIVHGLITSKSSFLLSVFEDVRAVHENEDEISEDRDINLDALLSEINVSIMNLGSLSKSFDISRFQNNDHLVYLNKAFMGLFSFPGFCRSWTMSTFFKTIIYHFNLVICYGIN